jgi:AcrR family transcriptional regulator
MADPAGAATEAFVPKRGRPRADQAEAISRQILNAATALFLAHGFDGTAMDTVASTAGIPKSTLYKRYTDKKALLRAVMEERVSTWSAVAARRNWMLTDRLDQRLRQYASWILTWAASPEVVAFSALAVSAWSSAEEREGRLDVTGFGRMVDLIEHDIVAFGPAAGIHAKDPRGVATALMALLSGWVQLKAPPGPVDEDAAASFANIAVDLIIHGSAAW